MSENEHAIPAVGFAVDVPGLPSATLSRALASLKHGTLPVILDSGTSAELAGHHATATMDDIVDPLVLDYALWPIELCEAHPALLSPRIETRRLAQFSALNRCGRRLDLAVGWSGSVASSQGTQEESPVFDAADPHLLSDRYLAFVTQLEATLPELTVGLAKHAARLATRVDAAMAHALASDAEARRAVFDRLTVADAASSIPWERLRPPTTGLAVLYNFSPFADTGSTVAAKRLRQFGATVDVVACSSVNRKKIDSTIEVLSRPYVSSQKFLDMSPSWASWAPFEQFCIKGLQEIESLEETGRDYEFLYSRAMWAPSHFLAAAYKLRRPSIKWTAEYSDPLSLDVEGNPRGGPVPRNPFLDALVAPVEREYGTIPEEHFTLFGLAEIIPFALSETVLFTNDLQRQIMLEHVYSPALAESVESRSVVSNHPTLPPEYYGARKVDYDVDPGKLNLAYFGEFYATRGITDLTVAMRMLPPAVREHINVHVFTNFIPEDGLKARPPGMSRAAFSGLVKRALDGVGADGIEHLVRFNASLPYLEFLGVTKEFDFLIVNDAHSGAKHSVNPYLPSKWSDYAGASAPAWALVEDGSSLSCRPAAVKTPVGDPNAARDMLWRLVEEKIGARIDA
ncbi:hypothetical protein [Arthrobacter sp. KK5.5]|uniref:hypothetical protein n=1 Tax=Arthrobacter sp. KK5.5 TaxID=3373084 RepID=UPI003EE744A0